MFKSVLVLAAHPDDEVLGCGGTIAKLADNGAKIHIAFLADGVLSRPTSGQKEEGGQLVARRDAARIAGGILGASSISFGDFPDNRMDMVSLLEIVRVAEGLIGLHKPDAIFTHHVGDVNIDHKRVHEAVVTACRPQSGLPVKTLLSFEIPSSTEWQLPGSAPHFAPNWFVDISTTLERKLAALNAYADELRPWPHSRSQQGVTYLARWRGSAAGMDAAEAFMLGRHLG